MIHAISTGALSVDVSTVGARIQQIRDRSDTGWLVETGRAEPDFGDGPVDFTAGTRGGWDDCLPSIDAEPDPSANRAVADHGDFWFRHWNVVSSDATSLSFVVEGPDHPLRITKTFQVEGSTLTIDARATNTGARDYSFLVSGHPLFNWPGDATIDVPGLTDVRHAFGVAVGTPGRERVELSRRLIPWTGKAFVRWTGVARATFAGHPGSLELRQDVETAPWLGICVNRGCWPEADPGPDWIALEPTTSPTDSLRAAVHAGTSRTLASGEDFAWSTSITIEAA